MRDRGAVGGARAAAAPLLAVLLASFPASLPAQDLPIVRAGAIYAKPGMTVSVPVAITHRDPAAGLSFGLYYDPGVAALTAIRFDRTALDPLGKVSFKDGSFDPAEDFATVGIAMDYQGLKALPPAANQTVVWFDFAVKASPSARTLPLTIDSAGKPEIAVELIDSLNQRVVPKAVSGAIRVVDVLPQSGLIGRLGSGRTVEVSWTNPDLETYSAVRILRDGASIATLQGDATEFVDVAFVGTSDFVVPTYEVQGVVAAQTSERLSYRVFVGSPTGRVWVPCGGSGDVYRADRTGARSGPFALGGATAPFGAALAPDGSVWVSAQGQDGGRVIHLDPDGKVLAAIAVGAGARGIASDRYGAIWVASETAGQLALIGQAGGILLGGDGAGDSKDDGKNGPAVALAAPVGVAADALGNAWVTSPSSGTLSRVSPNGVVVRTVSLAGEGASPTGVAVDGRGFVWVTLRDSARAVKLTPDGVVVARFATGAEPVGIAIDREDRAWVANRGAGSLSRIGPSGVDAFLLPGGASQPFGVSVDPVGGIWAACEGSGEAVLLSEDAGAALRRIPVGTGPRALGDLSGFAGLHALRPAFDADVDGFPNEEELEFGSDPFDRLSTPAGAVAVLPVRSLRCAARAGGIDLSWENVQPDADGISVLRDGKAIAALGGRETAYTDGAATPSDVHAYEVVARKGAMQSPPRRCAAKLGPGALRGSAPVAGANISDIAVAPDGTILAADAAEGKIRRFGPELAPIETFASPFASSSPLTGIAWRKGAPRDGIFLASAAGDILEIFADDRTVKVEARRAAGVSGVLGMDWSGTKLVLACSITPDNIDIFFVDPDPDEPSVLARYTLPVAPSGPRPAGVACSSAKAILLLGSDGSIREYEEDAAKTKLVETHRGVQLAPMDEIAIGGLATDAANESIFAAGIARNALLKIEWKGAFLKWGQVPGDGNGDGSLDLSDAVRLLFYLFAGDPPVLPCGSGLRTDPGNIALLDSSGDGRIGLEDAVHDLEHLFMGGNPPILGTACRPIAGCPETCTPR